MCNVLGVLWPRQWLWFRLPSSFGTECLHHPLPHHHNPLDQCSVFNVLEVTSGALHILHCTHCSSTCGLTSNHSKIRNASKYPRSLITTNTRANSTPWRVYCTYEVLTWLIQPPRLTTHVNDSNYQIGYWTAATRGCINSKKMLKWTAHQEGIQKTS